MKSEQRGASTSRAEVVGITPNGIWLLLGENEHFLSFELFPWFKNAAVSAVLQVESPQAHHLYWPMLDVDLHVDSITHPEKYPLVSKPSA